MSLLIPGKYNIMPGRYVGRGGQTGELEVFGEHGYACATFTCNHCCRVVFEQSIVKNQPRDICHSCNKLICINCAAEAAVNGCKTWEKKVEEAEARERLRRSIGIP